MEQENHRDSFALSYQINQANIQESERFPSDYEAYENPPADQHRLSQGKKKMLESFKQTIHQEPNSDEAQQLHISHSHRLSTPCSQIKEESNQSEGKTSRLALSPTKSTHIDHQSRKITRGSSLQMNQHTSLRPLSQSTVLISMSSIQTQKNELLASIEKAIHTICKGILIQKYCFGISKIQTVVLSFSEDFEFMSLFNIEKKETKVYPMKDFVNIQKGVKTERMKDYLQQEGIIHNQLVFSLVFKERSFDFSVDNCLTREQVVRDIQLLHESS